ncbi:MAG: hypothetical protein LBJ77_02575 [Holosporales bacterium]|jgi:hypothetical protein|nr:hypothetical protein [Holosporales bacterium]
MKTVTNIHVICAFCVFLFESSGLGYAVYPGEEQPEAQMPFELSTLSPTEIIALGATCGTAVLWCTSFLRYLITQDPFDLKALYTCSLMVGLFGAGVVLSGRLTELKDWMTH